MSWGKRFASGTLVFILVAGFFTFVFAQSSYRWNWAPVWENREILWQGWWRTVGISVICLIASVGWGLLLVLGKKQPFLPLRQLCSLYIELMRGTPLLVLVIIGFYGVANAFQLQSHLWMGVAILTAFNGAYLAEILRGGIEAVSKSQVESARAIGLSRAQRYRYVILPQAIRQSLPAATGQFIALIKDSSLLSVISVMEFTKAARDLNAITYSAFESFIPLALGYLLLTIPLSQLTQYLERRFSYES